MSQYYAAMAYKYGGMMSAAVAAIILAVADRFILGATGPEFVRAAEYVVPLTFFGAFQYLSWAGDHIQLGANKPYLKTALVIAGLGARLILAWVLIAQFQITGLIIAYFVNVLGEGLAAYWINQRLCFPQRLYVWQSLIAPTLAAVVHYLFLRGLTGLIWQGDQITSVIIFFIAILPSFPVYTFLYGLFGGGDPGTPEDVHSAAALTGRLRPVAEWGFYFPTRLGARLSPLNGRFPIAIRNAALIEANALTRENVRL